MVEPVDTPAVLLPNGGPQGRPGGMGYIGIGPSGGGQCWPVVVVEQLLTGQDGAVFSGNPAGDGGAGRAVSITGASVMDILRMVVVAEAVVVDINRW